MRNGGWAAPILIAIAVFVHDIGESSSARAESKTAVKKPAVVSALAPHWNHNGSVVSAVTQGDKQKFYYDAPRVGLLDVGVKSGTLLFEGQQQGKNISGTAYQFYRTCKSRGYQVSGATSDDRRQITLKGKVPVLDFNCNVTGTRDDVLIFTAAQTPPTEPSKETPVASTSQTKPAAPAASGIVEAKKPAAAAVPSAPPEAKRVTETPVVESSKVISGDSSTASTAVSVASAPAPSEAPKDKQVATAPPVEKAPPPPEEVKQPATQTASTATNSLAASNSAAPPSEPVKANQSVPAPGANAAAPKSEIPNTTSSSAEKIAATPKAEPPKDTQVAAVSEAAKTAAKTDDTSVAKNAAIVIPPPSNLPAKSEASKTEPPKTEPPKTEPPKTEAPKTEAPKIEAPKIEVAKAEPPKTEAPKTEAPKTEVAKTETPKTESSRTGILIESRPAPVTGPPEKMMEIVLKNGRILRIGRDVELEALSRIIAQLERQ
jgi:hypothetical protein